MNFERTFDREFIRRCVTDKYVWSMSSDDSPLDRELYFPNVPGDDSLIWVRAGDYGVFLGQKMNHVTYECHTVLLPCARGKALGIAKDAMQWFFENTSCLRLITQVPAYNRLAERLSSKSGMNKYGENPNSFMKHGVLYSTLLYGINKEDIMNAKNKEDLCQ